MFCILFFCLGLSLDIFFFFLMNFCSKKNFLTKKKIVTHLLWFFLSSSCVCSMCVGDSAVDPNWQTNIHTHICLNRWFGSFEFDFTFRFYFWKRKVHHSKRLMDFSREKNWLSNERKKNDWSIESSLFFDEFFFLFSLEEKWYSNKL